MKKLVVATGIAACLLLGTISATAEAGTLRATEHRTDPWVHRPPPAPISWRCVVEAARLGLFGHGVTLWDHTFVSGTEGSEGSANGPDQINVSADQVYCALGGDDVIASNHGIVIGGAGNDYMYTNRGTYYGGSGNDFAYYNEGTFYGGQGDDGVYAGPGFFDGGPGRDRTGLPGNCTNVEVFFFAPIDVTTC